MPLERLKRCAENVPPELITGYFRVIGSPQMCRSAEGTFWWNRLNLLGKKKDLVKPIMWGCLGAIMRARAFSNRVTPPFFLLCHGIRTSVGDLGRWADCKADDKPFWSICHTEWCDTVAPRFHLRASGSTLGKTSSYLQPTLCSPDKWFMVNRENPR